MAKRVTRTEKDGDGDIMALCGAWGRTPKVTAIREIDAQSQPSPYYVQDDYSRRADVLVVDGPTGKYLRSDPNSSCTDNLDNLPDC